MEAEVVERCRELKQHVVDHYAGKLDLSRLREEIAVQFGQVNVRFGELEARMARTEATLIKWFVATAFALAGTTFAIARYIP